MFYPPDGAKNDQSERGHRLRADDRLGRDQVAARRAGVRLPADPGRGPGSAATVALLVPAAEDQRRRAQFDLGQATMSIMMAAAALEVGSSH